MTTKAVTLRDVYLSSWERRIFRYSPAAVPGGYEKVWELDLPQGYGIGMTDDGTHLYAASWSAATIYRIKAEAGTFDTTWQVSMAALGCQGGDMESMSLRVKGNRKSLIVGYADGFTRNINGNSVNHDWAEVDIATKTLIKTGKNTLAYRGCDWVWVINPDEFVTGTETSYFVKINIETGECVQYMPAVGGVSYTIEVRKSRLIAVTGNSGPVVLGHTDSNGRNPVVDRAISINPYDSIYFASSLESDGKHFWFSSYGGDIRQDTVPNATPVWRVDAISGAGNTAPQFYVPGSWQINGIYCLSHARESNLRGDIAEQGIRYDPTLDTRRRLAVR